MANNITRREPFGPLVRFDPFSDFDELFRDFFTAPALRGREAAPPIRVDIAENQQNYVIKAEMPGVQKDDIKVSIDGNRVSISAEVKQERQANDATTGDGGGNMLRSERFYGQQYRSFTLPQEVDDAAAQARYTDGVLELTLPKKAGTGGKQLSIQ
ncbi:MAG TPA: Hsp20/alpha crystallin family protein [Janthinobacterium sp.]|jgi:HSP20 family protein|nr:Hsp20/alpha crystallin family protein [Janthinobacterium sp.]